MFQNAFESIKTSPAITEYKTTAPAFQIKSEVKEQTMHIDKVIMENEQQSQNPFSLAVPQKILPSFRDSGSIFSAIETKTTIYEKLNSTPNDANNETKNAIMPRFEKKSRRNKGKRVGV